MPCATSILESASVAEWTYPLEQGTFSACLVGGSCGAGRASARETTQRHRLLLEQLQHYAERQAPDHSQEKNEPDHPDLLPRHGFHALSNAARK